MFSFQSRVRYSEAGMDKKLTLNGIINYFQDCSTFHSESLGVGLEELEKEGKVWVLSAWQIVVERYRRLVEKMSVETWPYDFSGFYGMRNFALRDEQGELLAWANSLWVFMDTRSGRPARVTPIQVERYAREPMLPMEYAPRKVPVPKGSAERESFVVLKHQLDTNRHVNNGQYVQMAADFLPEGFAIGQMRAEYKKSAQLGDRIVPYVYEEETEGRRKLTVSLCEEDGKPYAVVEFTEKAGPDSGAAQPAGC